MKNRYLHTAWLLCVLLAAAFLFSPPQFLHAADNLKKITILYTNDTHSRLLPFKQAVTGKSVGGIERRAAYFSSVKKENPLTLVLDAGDLSQGTPFYNFFKGAAEFKAFALAGYDYLTVGNHELDYGLDNLKFQARAAGLEFLCANLFDSKTLKPLFTPFKIKNIGGVKIAIVGIMGKEAWDVVSNKYKEGVLYADEFALLKKLFSLLSGKVDLIVLLSHSGYQYDIKLAGALPEIDVIIGSHTHTKMDKPLEINNPLRPLNKTIVTQAFENGVYAGRLDFYFDGGNRPLKYVASYKLIDSSIRVDKKSQLRRHIKYYEDKMKDAVSVKIGESEVEMDNMADMFNSLDTPMGRYICDALKDISGSDIFFTNTTTFRDRMPAGAVTIETLLKIVPFDNSVVVFEMSGASLLKMMDFIALNFGKNESFQYGGIAFTIDMNARAARDIFVGGSPVDKDKIYKVATSSYIAQGNLMGGEMFKEALANNDTGVCLRDMMMEYIKKNPKINAPPGGRLKLIKKK
jgi:2',3'-cyclic-nucleotide 2'-phosphodiesterase (5'-nucleotidase family)